MKNWKERGKGRGNEGNRGKIQRLCGMVRNRRMNGEKNGENRGENKRERERLGHSRSGKRIVNL